MNKGILLVAVSAMILFAASLSAQTTLGEISGFLKDSEGKAVLWAELRLTGQNMMGIKSTHSTDNGYYRFIKLSPGKYTLTITKDNYQTQDITNLYVRAGKTSTLNVTLEVGDFKDTITIVHDAPLIDLKNTKRSINIDGAFLDRLPLSTTREWVSVLSLVPSVVRDDDFTGGDLDDNISSVSFHGASTSENTFSMDGAIIQTDTIFDPVLFTSAVIEDVEVVTSGFDASVRNGLGGYINVVTKSGGNDLHGTFQVALQPEDWNWENVENGHTPKSELYMPEASIGGPILKDQVWFFASVLYDYRNQSVYRDENTLYWFDQFGFSPSDYNYVNERRNMRFFSKVTTTLSKSDKIMVTFNWDRTNNLTGMDYSTASARTQYKKGGPMFNLNYTKFFSDNFFVSLQGTYREAETGGFPISGDPADAATQIYRYDATFDGSEYNLNSSSSIKDGGQGEVFSRFERHSEIKGDMNLFLDDLWGQHDTRFGFYYLPERKFSLTYTYALPYTTVYKVRDVNGNWMNYRAVHLSDSYPGEEYINAYAAGYLQDSWTLNERMTLNCGLRFEKNFDKVDIYGKTTVSPNIGFSYALTSDRKHALRLSFSRRQEVLSNLELKESNNASWNAGASYYYDYNLDGVWDRVTDYPEEEIIPNTRESLTTPGGSQLVDENIEPSYADFFQIGYSAVLPWNVTFDSAFIYNIFSNDITSYSYYNYLWENNEPVALRDPSRTSVRFYTNDKWSSRHYRGLEFSLSRAFLDNWQIMTSYAYQTTTERGEWSPYSPERYYFQESWFEYNNPSNRPEHVFRLAASYVGPWGIMANGNVVYRSSLPNTAYRHSAGVGIDYPRYIELNGMSVRHPFTQMTNWAQPRSAEREGIIGSATVINLGIGKIFEIGSYRLETQLQVFNIFNDATPISGRANYVDENLEYTSTIIRSIQAPRAAQLLVKLVF